jgi:hypothetical protein
MKLKMYVVVKKKSKLLEIISVTDTITVAYASYLYMMCAVLQIVEKKRN